MSKRAKLFRLPPCAIWVSLHLFGLFFGLFIYLLRNRGLSDSRGCDIVWLLVPGTTGGVCRYLLRQKLGPDIT
jgi:hypothetical protein